MSLSVSGVTAYTQPNLGRDSQMTLVLSVGGLLHITELSPLQLYPCNYVSRASLLGTQTLPQTAIFLQGRVIHQL